LLDAGCDAAESALKMAAEAAAGGRALAFEPRFQSAREIGFVQNEGLAHEVAARFYLARGFRGSLSEARRRASRSYPERLPTRRKG
jgi:hypothetical protein